MLRETFFALTLGVVLGGCSSPVSASARTSPWVACAIDEDCAETPSATMCASGYCVDGQGSRIARSSSALHSCNPLTPRPAPVKLGTVLGVGRDDAGTTYLVDSYDIAGQDFSRVFVSDGNVLVRRERVGMVGVPLGALTDTGEWDRYDFDDGGQTRTIVVTRAFSQDHPENFVTTEMSIGPSDGFDPSGAPVGFTPLTLQNASVLSDFTYKNLADPDRMSVLAYVDDGTVILTTRPALESTANEGRVFWGRPDDMREHRLFSYEPGTNRLLFDNGSGGVVTIAFTYSRVDGGIEERGTLSGPGISATITMVTDFPQTLPEDLSFSCR